MKIPSASISLALAFVSLGQISLFAAEPAPQEQAAKVPPQTFEAEVIKVFSAKDGAAIFRAYLVMWKGQEVIVSDSLARTDFKQGDVITVLGMNHPFPQGREPYRLLAFTVAPRRN